MNTVFVILFRIYQIVFRTSVASCRFEPTCSQYLIDATKKHGTVKGLYLALKRLLSCHPLSKRPYYDPA